MEPSTPEAGAMVAEADGRGVLDFMEALIVVLVFLRSSS